MSVSRARELLADADASKEPSRTKRHLLVAAALREVLGQEPIVVGGTAEDFYTGDLYRETDLDLCGWLQPHEEKVLVEELGFTRQTFRHLYHASSNVAVEFPDDSLVGDVSRAHREPVGRGIAVIISPEDLYMDRLEQAAAILVPPDKLNLNAALAVALAQYDHLDWKYIDTRIRQHESKNESNGRVIRKLHRQVRRKVLRTT